MPNVELLKRVLQHIEANPDKWDQSDWITAACERPEGCGTAYCFAGWAAVLSGASIDEDDEVQRDDLPAEIANVDCSYWPASKGFLHVADAARHLLGLSAEQAEELFHEDNNLADLRQMVAKLCSETAGNQS